MTVAMFLVLVISLLLTAHLASIVLAASFFRYANKPALAGSSCVPGISLVRPLCGVEEHSVATIDACFALTYPNYEILFCVAHAIDPIIPVVRAAIENHPDTRAQLLVGDDVISLNPKLNNMVKAWSAARHERICFADSNLLVPADYLERVLAAWSSEAGAVSAAPIGIAAENFGGAVECAFLNTFEARWQYAAAALGYAFCQGKTLCFEKSLLLDTGLAALASEPAEDAALTKIVRAAGLQVRLASPPFGQPIGHRRLQDVWARQVRWARLRRVSFPLCYAPELFLGFVPACLVLILLLWRSDHVFVIPWGCAALLALWYLAEAWLAWCAGWSVSWAIVATWLFRDLLLPLLWCQAWLGRGYVWRGVALRAADSGPALLGQPYVSSERIATLRRLIRRWA